ncbi:histone-like nucleoid-structuring protein Lsr2 [Nocardia acidivorans]|uniref:histone-like nucleoid-structuring protein Lsr2 n=1 Tax=Nocardia acidivorans TaxID=404580 RepID=UPI00082D3ABB|nr:Lsr2 family protein [Nocardia acidivorans]
MARKVIVEMVDDYDGTSIAVETVQFALDGTDYEIDLSTLNAAALRGVFEQWTPHARKVSRTSREKVAKPRPAADREQTQAIRDWARRNGFDVSSRGRVSAQVVAAYNKAAA